MTAETDPPEISHAAGSIVHATDGRSFIDLTIGFGAVFLGHAHPHVTQRLHDQVSRVWLCARSPTPAASEADERIRTLLPAGLKPGGLYSTGMEAAEFAMRLAAHHSGRSEFAGFARSMHGKSGLTAALCWQNALIPQDRVHILPFVDQVGEDELLGLVAQRLAGGRIAALFVEPIQGSNGGHEASADFYNRVLALCRDAGTYCVFDEILTGLYRTGRRFYVDGLATRPDFLLFAKSMANGFPVSSLAVRTDLAIAAPALPGSTFSGNPLAATAVAATLEAMAALPMADRVAAIDRTVREGFGGHGPDAITLRGRGALWILEVGPRIQVPRMHAAITASGLLVSSHGRCIRVLPAATIDLGVLSDACAKIVAAVTHAYA